jgi:hypothetical protein
MTRFSRPMIAVAVAAWALLGATAASALPITGLFNTGVDGAANPLAVGASDPHYTITETGGQAVVMTPHPVWLVRPDARWIWQAANGAPVNVTRTFRATFDLTGLDPSTAIIEGFWAADNEGDILLNGASTGQSCGSFPSTNPFKIGCNFTVNAGFVSGVNTLDFVVRDFGVIAGLLVDDIRGSAEAAAVPEPAALALFAFGLAGLGALRRRRAVRAVF